MEKDYDLIWFYICKEIEYTKSTHEKHMENEFDLVKFLHFFKQIEHTTSIVSGQLPREDSSPPYMFWSWWVLLFRGSGPSGELSWLGIVLGIVEPGGQWLGFIFICMGNCPQHLNNTWKKIWFDLNKLNIKINTWKSHFPLGKKRMYKIYKKNMLMHGIISGIVLSKK